MTLARVAEQEQDDTKSSEGSNESKDKNEDDDWLCHHGPGADDVHLLTS